MNSSDHEFESPNTSAPISSTRHWRSLDELSGATDLTIDTAAEFPEQADVWPDDLRRRHFLQVMGASLALSGAAGCMVQPEEKIVPYVRAPEAIVPGRPLYFATASLLGGFATGIVVESHMGRPTKVEGNPNHPASLGATDIFAQASVLTLYDPDRSQVVRFNGRVSTWDRFLEAFIEIRTRAVARKGAGLRILTGTSTSPTEARLLGEVLKLLPEARVHEHEPVGHESSRRGSELAFKTIVSTILDIERADVLVAIDSDFLASGPAHLTSARAFAARREPGQPANRLYALETSPSVTGAAADHRWPLRADELQAFAIALAGALGVEGVPKTSGFAQVWFDHLLRDLLAHKGRSLILVGETQPPWVHALAHGMNQVLGNVGETVKYVESAIPQPFSDGASLAELISDIESGAVETLLTLGSNPVYDAPADLEFGRRYLKVPTRIHLGLYADETAELSNWHIPQAHSLETWSDARAHDGTVTILQPLIGALYSGRIVAELLAALVEGSPPRPRALVEATWRSDRDDQEFREFWTRTLNQGLVSGSESAQRQVLLQPFSATVPEPSAGDGLELHFRPDPTIRDGAFANNGWLQELPKPLSTLTWDNAAQVGPTTARRYDLTDGDVVELTYRDRTLRVPTLVTPGHAEGAVTLTLGYGRWNAGRVGNKTTEQGGFNAYALRTSDAPWGGSGLTLKKTGERYEFALTQVHWTMPNPNTEAEKRELVRVTTHSKFELQKKDHSASGHASHDPNPRLTLFEHPEPMQRRIDGYGNRWGMSINLSACIGCNVCVIACQAENNIPVVGKDQVIRGREMHWLRIDRYYAAPAEGDSSSNPRVHFQPVMCMHCENAPCEIVCPVGATTHSAEGLNEMTYNRCVGTRYCSNNCPYKVRRFNFFQYAEHDTPSLKLLNNPDVTVRTRGVMEKCTYCVQRINQARIESEIAGEPRVTGNAVLTACQQACPTRAIVFGNMNDLASDVAAAKHDKRTYGLLAELNTRPRTTYLKKLINPNPAIEA
jgi:molybdopterin-containing oxidoreductase family iron-sulfur binding subunit